MACIELDKSYINENGKLEPKFKVLFRVEIPRSNFTYTEAVNKIIELNEIYSFDKIAIDRGSGEMQIETLRKYGIDNPSTGLAEKVEGYQFSEKIAVRDPYTGKKDKKPMKPFMVNNSVNLFEKEKIVFHPTDKKILDQFGSYRIKSISPNGVPIFNSDDEHIVDAVNLALLSFAINYDDMLRRVITSKVILLHEPLAGKEEILTSTRKLASEANQVKIIGFNNKGTNMYKNPYANSNTSTRANLNSYSRSF